MLVLESGIMMRVLKRVGKGNTLILFVNPSKRRKLRINVHAKSDTPCRVLGRRQKDRS
jgi:hypothetical protein